MAWDLPVCVEQDFPTNLLFKCLPYHLALLPALCRTLAFMTVLPLLCLALMDLVGWAVFKLILRPLGYASTIRFKDPDPSDRIGVPADASMIGTSKHLSDTDDNASSTASSPTFPHTPLFGQSPASKDSKPLPSVPEHDTAHADTGSPSLSNSKAKGSSAKGARSAPAPKMRRRRSASSTGSDISIASMRHERAPSVGVDGPLLGQSDDEQQRDGDESDDESEENDGEDGEGDDYEHVEVIKDSAAAAERGGEDESTKRHSSVRARKNLPRGGPSFGFTSTKSNS